MSHRVQLSIIVQICGNYFTRDEFKKNTSIPQMHIFFERSHNFNFFLQMYLCDMQIITTHIFWLIVR